jgi:hypothetical protein
MSKGLGRFQRTVLGTLIEGVETDAERAGFLHSPFWSVRFGRRRTHRYRGLGDEWMPLQALQAALYGTRQHARYSMYSCIGEGNKANLQRALATLQARGLVAGRWRCPECGQTGREDQRTVRDLRFNGCARRRPGFDQRPAQLRVQLGGTYATRHAWQREYQATGAGLTEHARLAARDK